MPLIPRKQTEQAPEPKRPLFERVQEWIFKMDVGSGLSWFRVGLFSLVVLAVMLIYTGTQFYGLRDREAMDMSQLGRNLAEGKGYTTRWVRPFVAGYLVSIQKPPLVGKRDVQPELWTPPIYPLILSASFRLVTPNFDLSAGRHSVGADRQVMVISWLFYLLGLLLLYMLAREMFDHRVAILSVYLYLFCDSLLDFAVSGLPMNFLTVIFLLTCHGVIKAEKWAAAKKPAAWVYGALAVSAFFVGIGVLTQYAFISVLIPLLVYVGVSFPKNWGNKVILCIGVFLLVLAPWVVRNLVVSKTLLGLSRYELYEGTGAGTKFEIRPGQIQRSYRPEVNELKFRRIFRKALMNIRVLYESTFKDVGENYLFAFFLVALMHRFRLEEVFRLRRYVFWSILTSLVWLGFTGPTGRNFLTVFMPLVIVYSAAFFYVLFERLQFRKRFLRVVVVGTFAILNALPFVFSVLPPITTSPYPPYEAGVLVSMRKVFRPEEAMISDIPWAVSWYADRLACWTTNTKEEFEAVNLEVHYLSAVYVTQETMKDVTALDLFSGYHNFWISLLFEPEIRNSIRMQYIQSLPPDGKQALISNVERKPPPPGG